MWSFHIFFGLQFGFEFYDGEKIDDSKNIHSYSFFIIDIGCIRIQRQDYLGMNL